MPFFLFILFRGFCFFNSVAIAAKLLQQKLAISKILIVDWVRFFFPFSTPEVTYSLRLNASKHLKMSIFKNLMSASIIKESCECLAAFMHHGVDPKLILLLKFYFVLIGYPSWQWNPAGILQRPQCSVHFPPSL